MSELAGRDRFFPNRGALVRLRILFLSAVIIFAALASGERPNNAPRIVDLKTPDGTILKATYFAAVKPGPGVLLLHQSNRTRKSWDKLAPQLAAAGFNTLTLDMYGFGESGGKTDKPTRLTEARDVDTAFQYLVSQPGVKRNLIGVGGAGWLGIDNSVTAARRHP